MMPNERWTRREAAAFTDKRCKASPEQQFPLHLHFYLTARKQTKKFLSQTGITPLRRRGGKGRFSLVFWILKNNVASSLPS